MKYRYATEKIVPVSDERIVNKIMLIRGKKVMFDRDLAELYGVETGALNRAVKRNQARFPGDFMFQLTTKELEILRCQNGISSLRSQTAISKQRGGRRYQPYVFTEQGVAMLSSVLKSERAIHINILIIKAFVRMRELLETNETLRHKLEELERTLGKHSRQIQQVYAVIQRLLEEPKQPPQIIGFQPVRKKT